MLRSKMESLFSVADQAINDVIKEQGIDMFNEMGDMDTNSLHLMASVSKMYAIAKDLSFTMGDMMDKQQLEISCLVKMNEELIRQTLNMREEQRLLIAKIEKIEQANTCKCSKKAVDQEKK